MNFSALISFVREKPAVAAALLAAAVPAFAAAGVAASFFALLLAPLLPWIAALLVSSIGTYSCSALRGTCSCNDLPLATVHSELLRSKELRIANDPLAAYAEFRYQQGQSAQRNTETSGRPRWVKFVPNIALV